MAHLTMIDVTEPALPGKYPVVPLRDIVVFPHLVYPLFVGREKSIRAVEHALATDRFLFLAAQRDVQIEDPAPENLYSVGTICLLLRMLRVKEGKLKILVQGICKAEVLDFIQTKAFFMAEVKKAEIEKANSGGAENERLISDVKSKLDKLIFEHGQAFPIDVLAVIENLKEPDKLAHMIAGNIGLDVPRDQEILEIKNPVEKLIFLSNILGEHIRTLRGEKDHS
jgi:ATP-dependent Lon protease